MNYQFTITRTSLTLLGVALVTGAIAIFLAGMTLGFNMLEERVVAAEANLSQSAAAPSTPPAANIAQAEPEPLPAQPPKPPAPPPLERPIHVATAEVAAEPPPMKVPAAGSRIDMAALESEVMIDTLPLGGDMLPPPDEAVETPQEAPRETMVEAAEPEPMAEAAEEVMAEAAVEPMEESPLPADAEPVTPPAEETIAALEEETPAVDLELKAGGPIYEIQVGLFLSKNNAQKLYERLLQAGYAVRQFSAVGASGRTWHAVRVGRFGSVQEATAAAKRLKEKEGLSTLIAAPDELS